MRIVESTWDGEDLFQETMLKAYRRFLRWPERELSKPYLFRIASNTWLDICRRKRIAFQPDFLINQADVAYEEWSPYDVRESLETLMDALEPRQAALILLTDVFGFSPSETATVLGQPVTAVKAALHRARNKLKKAADRHFHLLDMDNKETEKAISKADGELLETFVMAFRNANFNSLFLTYRELSVRGLKIGRVRVIHGHVWFSFLDPDCNVFTVTSPLIQQSEV